MSSSDLRIQKGQAIAATGRVVRSRDSWLVPSLSSDAVYRVTLGEDGELRCTCPDFKARGGPCKHQISAALVASEAA